MAWGYGYGCTKYQNIKIMNAMAWLGSLRGDRWMDGSWAVGGIVYERWGRNPKRNPKRKEMKWNGVTS